MSLQEMTGPPSYSTNLAFYVLQASKSVDLDSALALWGEVEPHIPENYYKLVVQQTLDLWKKNKNSPREEMLKEQFDLAANTLKVWLQGRSTGIY